MENRTAVDRSNWMDHNGLFQLDLNSRVVFFADEFTVQLAWTNKVVLYHRYSDLIGPCNFILSRNIPVTTFIPRINYMSKSVQISGRLNCSSLNTAPEVCNKNNVTQHLPEPFSFQVFNFWSGENPLVQDVESG